MSRGEPLPSARTGPSTTCSASRVLMASNASRHVRVTMPPLTASGSQSYTSPSCAPSRRASAAYAWSACITRSTASPEGKVAASSGTTYSATRKRDARSLPGSSSRGLWFLRSSEHGAITARASKASTSLPAMLKLQPPTAPSVAVSFTARSAASSCPGAASKAHCRPGGGSGSATVFPRAQCSATARSAASTSSRSTSWPECRRT
mmetsp:Transcript_40995/g.135830  ORF Transcript_40995/g.135830 Transcript_40995/m.135830 type:complete len:206 (+) Transcript_40995:129-746(+)